MHPNYATIPVMPKNDEPRYNAQGQLLCYVTAKNTGQPCRAIAMRGQRVCRIHGGSSPQAKAAAKRRLLELVEPAIARLAEEVDKADTARDRLKAAEMILDRTGFGKEMKVELDEMKFLLSERIREIKKRKEQDGDA